MSKTINIGENQIARVYLSGFVKIKNDLDQITYIYPYEFNRLAMEAPLFKRVVAKLAQLDNFYPNDEELERLLEDIAELEKPG